MDLIEQVPQLVQGHFGGPLENDIRRGEGAAGYFPQAEEGDERGISPLPGLAVYMGEDGNEEILVENTEQLAESAKIQGFQPGKNLSGIILEPAGIERIHRYVQGRKNLGGQVQIAGDMRSDDVDGRFRDISHRDHADHFIGGAHGRKGLSIRLGIRA